VFASAYGQAPLYYSNQNQYFLHGLAEAGVGLLPGDWLANTCDPTPLFSGLVALTARFLHPAAFYLYHALLLGAYAAALVGLFATLAGDEAAARRWPVFAALLVLTHSAVARWLSHRLLGYDYPWYLQTGLATQYVLGAMFQPSVFGVLLVAAVCLFGRGRPFTAAVCVALAATIHSTYLLPGALLTLGFLAALLRGGERRRALVLAAVTLLLVLPVVAYTVLAFAPTSPEAFAEAQDILVNLRIPHHARPDLWFDPIAAAQVGWMVLGLVLARRTTIFLVLAVPFALMVVLTLIQVATGSPGLALLFPWRVSAVLVPVSTAVVLTRLATIPSRLLDRPAVPTACVALMAVLAAGGLWICVGGLAFRTGDEDVAVMDFVRGSAEPGDVYFVPVSVPDLVKSTRGSLSSDFKPPAAKRQDVRLIPSDLQRFRLAAEVPIFIDFKSIPYRDIELIEWRDRIRVAQRVQDQIAAGRLADAVAELRHHGVTHLVQPAARHLSGPGLHLIYSDTHYRVYQLTGTP
jgi:hypothetical protein